MCLPAQGLWGRGGAEHSGELVRYGWIGVSTSHGWGPAELLPPCAASALWPKAIVLSPPHTLRLCFLPHKHCRQETGVCWQVIPSPMVQSPPC